jgi:hypothetical protein
VVERRLCAAKKLTSPRSGLRTNVGSGTFAPSQRLFAYAFRMENARQRHVIDYSDYRSDPVVDRRITDLAV